MMRELADNVLDIAQNSVAAGASLLELTITVDEAADLITLIFSDNGCGMTEEQLAKLENPFFTTRKTRKVGLGIPFLKMLAEKNPAQAEYLVNTLISNWWVYNGNPDTYRQTRRELLKSLSEINE